MTVDKHLEGISAQVVIQSEDFNISQQYEYLRRVSNNAGAIVTFTGLVREFFTSSASDPAPASMPAPVNGTKEAITELFLEHYPGMTEKVLYNIIHQACERWPLQAVTIIHRVGQLKPGDQIVLVGVSSAHRKAAFEAGEYLMDFLKTEAPFWKKESVKNHQSQHDTRQWLETKDSDQEAAERW